MLNDVTPGQLSKALCRRSIDDSLARFDWVSGLGQIPGITPVAITNIAEVNARARAKLVSGSEFETLRAIDAALKAGTAGAALTAIVAFQGGLAETIGAAKKGLASFGTALARFVGGLDPSVRVAEKGWKDSVAFAENAIKFVGAPADLLKKQLKMLPPDQKLSAESLHEVERQLLSYAIAMRGVTWSLKIASTNLREALVPAGPAEVVEATLRNMGVTIGWVLSTTLKGAGAGSIPILKAIPWWGWAIGGLLVVNYLAPALSLVRQKT